MERRDHLKTPQLKLSETHVQDSRLEASAIHQKTWRHHPLVASKTFWNHSWGTHHWVTDDLKEHFLTRPSPLWRGDVWATVSVKRTQVVQRGVAVWGRGGRVGVHFRLSAQLKWLSQGGYWLNNNTRHRLDCRNIITVAKHVEHDVCLCFSKTCVFTSPLPLHPHTPNEKQNPTAVTLVSPGSPQCPVLSQGVLPSWAYRFSYFSPFFLMSHSRRCGDGFTFGLVNTTCCSWRKKNLNICVCVST